MPKNNHPTPDSTTQEKHKPQTQPSRSKQPSNNNDHHDPQHVDNASRKNSTNTASKASNVPRVPHVPDWVERLHLRGVGDSQIKFFGITPGKAIFHDPLPGETKKDFEIVTCGPEEAHGWTYPIYYPGIRVTHYRLKNFKEHAEHIKVLSPKENRLPGGKHPPYYIPSQAGYDFLVKAIKHNDGILYVVEGEPDVWALHGMGIFNCTAYYGSQSIVSNLDDHFEALGVKKVIFITDNDEAGQRSAKKISDAFYYSSLSFEIWQTPEEYDGVVVKDTTDVIQAVKFDQERFTDYFDNTLPEEVLIFDPPENERYLGARENAELFAHDNFDRAQLIEDVIEAINNDPRTVNPIRKFNDRGWSNDTQCPTGNHTNDAKKPRFGINIETGACFCHKCGVQKLRDVAALYNIQLRDYFRDDPLPQSKQSHNQRDYRIAQPQSQSQQVIDIGQSTNFFEVQRNQKTVVDYANTSPDLFFRRRRDVMDTAIKRARGELTDFNSYSVAWPMDDPQFLALGGFCELIPAGKLVEIIAPTGGGKCITGDSLVSTPNGLISILSLKPEGVPGEPDGEGGIFYPLVYPVWTNNGLRRTSHFYESGLRDTLTVTTSSGLHITGTYQHRLYAQRSLFPIWVPMKDLVIGDFIQIESGFTDQDRLYGDEKYAPRLTMEEIVSIEYSGKQLCYDLTVDDEHSFIANGIICHNTTFLKSLEIAFNRSGINTILWSPEFDEIEHGDHTIQMMTGVSSIRAMRNDQYYIEAIRNADREQDGIAFGQIFDEYERKKTLDGAYEVMGLPGESYIINRFGRDVYDMLNIFEYTCDYALAEGREIQVVLIDYAQLMQKPHGERDWDVNNAILAFKEWCNYNGPYTSVIDGQTRMRRRKVGVVTSQATKVATKALQLGEQEYLTPEDAMVLRPDWFNLILSLKMGQNYNYRDGDGPWREYFVHVVKNSKGDKREYNDGQNGAVKMYFDMRKMRIVYKSARTQDLRTVEGRVVQSPSSDHGLVHVSETIDPYAQSGSIVTPTVSTTAKAASAPATKSNYDPYARRRTDDGQAVEIDRKTGEIRPVATPKPGKVFTPYTLPSED